eukprot:TRINITY_DN8803_c0_g1_i1.p1 TRINITY_DN8803_c0_g1~~TRINITY_DN8803_c0_g1_i1.p1  ORF type:complete len:554 (-),score=105.78 TRINITY_DN8803_c0_g1_i1:153-1793(-)
MSISTAGARGAMQNKGDKRRGPDANALSDLKKSLSMREGAKGADNAAEAEQAKEGQSLREVNEEAWNDTLNAAGLDSNALRSVLHKKHWVESPVFELSIGVVILLNCICIGVEMDLAEKTGKNLWLILENIFCGIWIIEMLIKICHFRLLYFYDRWNWLDMFLVGLSIFDAWISPFIGAEDSGFEILRLVRILRILRLLKLVRALQMSRNLWLLVQGFTESLSTLNWVLLLIMLVMYCFAVLLRILVDCKREPFTDWAQCDEMFGDILKTMYTLFQLLTLESWSMAIGRPLVTRQPALFIVLLLYLGATTFGLLNIIVGVIVENTLNVASQNADLQNKRMQRQLLKELEILKTLFEAADADGSGTLDKEEFCEIIEVAEVKNALIRMEVPVDQPEALFDLVDADKQGEVTFQLFAKGVQKVRGPPTGLDMKAMLIAVRDISSRQIKLQHHIEGIHAGLNSFLESHGLAAVEIPAARPECESTFSSPPLSEASDEEPVKPSLPVDIPGIVNGGLAVPVQSCPPLQIPDAPVPSQLARIRVKGRLRTL